MGAKKQKPKELPPGLTEETLHIYRCPEGHASLATEKPDRSSFECLRCEIDALTGAESPKRNLDARNAIDESLAKVLGVLGVITSFAREEDFKDVQNACWLISDEIERLEERLGDLGL